MPTGGPVRRQAGYCQRWPYGCSPSIARSENAFTSSDYTGYFQRTSRERLKLLLVSTVADIRAVGPGVWTGWKGQLLRTLYFETEPLLGGGHTTLTRSERVARAQDALRERLSNWPKDDLERFIDRHYPAYWLRTDLDVIADNFKRLQKALPLVHIYYAVKANPAPEILSLLAELGACFDVASLPETHAALAAGATADRISYGNTIKKERDIARAHALGVRLFAVDCLAEVEKVARAAPGMICIFVTGGTFDKEYNELEGTLYFKDTHVREMLGLGRCRLELEVRTLMMIDSLEMTDRDRELILKSCLAPGCDRMVITHGTDTMAETARYLGERVKDRTIVLTGAMVPYTFGSSDGLFNLGSALAFAQTLPAGVFVAMNGRTFDWNNVRKNKTSGAFEELAASP